MKITLLFFACLVYSFTIYSQSLIDYLLPITLNDKQIELIKSIDIPENKRKTELLKLKGHEFFENLNKAIDNYNDDFIFIDLNSDSLLDILYSGYMGGAADPYAYIFLNNGKNYSTILYSTGFWKYLVLEKGRFKGLLFCNFPSFDPCPQIIKMELLTFTDNLYSTEIASFDSETTIPFKSLNTPINFKVNNSNYYLRRNPYIDNDKLGDCNSIGNIVATYKADDTGTAYAESKDETGRIWWFVVMDNKTVGWISSRYLTKE